jgi:hypothetical protein
MNYIDVMMISGHKIPPTEYYFIILVKYIINTRILSNKFKKRVKHASTN